MTTWQSFFDQLTLHIKQFFTVIFETKQTKTKRDAHLLIHIVILKLCKEISLGRRKHKPKPNTKQPLTITLHTYT